MHHPRMNGTIVWQYCDIRVDLEPRRALSRPRSFNNKGLVNEYRHPKMAYYTVKKAYTAQEGAKGGPPMEEESVFENIYPRTREVLQEVLRYTHFQSRRALAVWILDTVLIVLTLVLVWWTRQWTPMLVLALALLICRLLSICYNYRRGVRLMLARDREQYGEAPVEVRTALTQTGIRILPTAGKDVKIAYENIRYAVQTRHLILIFTRAKLFHMLHKDGFTKGTAEKCVAFLREKGVKVR